MRGPDLETAPGLWLGGPMEGVRGVLLDIDGVLTVSWRPIPGAVEALDRLREVGLATVLLTNTTSRTRAAIASALAGAGFAVGAEDIVTAPTATAAYLAAHHPGARCRLLSSGDIAADLGGTHLVEEDADVVVVGGAGPEFDYARLNAAFADLRRGAHLVAMHRNLYWRTEAGLRLDGGAFVTALEQAAGVRAEVVGKPAEGVFSAALGHLRLTPDEAVMVGDNIETDVLAAQNLGMTGVLVRTGAYLPEAHAAAAAEPDHVLDSVADLPGLLGRGARHHRA